MAAPLVANRAPSGATTGVAASAQPRASARLAFIDNIRVFLTILVIAHHAGQAYGPTGGDWPIFDAERARILGPFFSINAAFFMGLFFLISGYFLPGAYDRKGAGPFLKDRALRLGLPLLVFGLAAFGPLTYLDYAGSPEGAGRSFWSYFFRVYLGDWRVEFAHLWFIAHLLVYAAGYAAWRRFARPADRRDARRLPIPSPRAIALYTVALALVTFAVRVRFPVDRWVNLGIVPVEVAHLPQYLSLFIIGILAARGDWLRRLPTSTGLTLLALGLGAAALRYAYALGGWGLLAAGGINRGSLIWSGWEAIICVGLCAGLLTLARERFNAQGAILRGLSANAYAAYVLHLWPVVGLQFALASVALPPFAKFALVTLVGVPLSLAVGALIRRLPRLGDIL